MLKAGSRENNVQVVVKPIVAEESENYGEVSYRSMFSDVTQESYPGCCGGNKAWKRLDSAPEGRAQMPCTRLRNWLGLGIRFEQL
jgi:hypothetical protein